MYHRLIPLFASIILFNSTVQLSASETPEKEVDFAREVLPILSDKCFVCHGPDAEDDFLRLDSFESATADLGDYQAINPASPDDSEILARIHDKENPMPPAEAEKPLTDNERELITNWIQQGGAYKKHWAFVPPVKVALPGRVPTCESNRCLPSSNLAEAQLRHRIGCRSSHVGAQGSDRIDWTSA